MQKYSLSMRLLHWAMAFVFGVLLCAVWFSGYGDKRAMYGLHKSLGLLALGLVVIRLYARAATKSPALEGNSLEESLRHVGHFCLYALMLLVPLTMALPALLNPQRGLDFFGLHVNAIADSPEIGGAIAAFHVPLAYTLVIFIVGHIAMALYHHFVRKDKLLHRIV